MSRGEGCGSTTDQNPGHLVALSCQPCQAPAQARTGDGQPPQTTRLQGWSQVGCGTVRSQQGGRWGRVEPIERRQSSAGCPGVVLGPQRSILSIIRNLSSRAGRGSPGLWDT